MIKITWKTQRWLNPGRGEGSRGSAETSENFAEANEAHSSNPTPEEAGNSSDRGSYRIIYDDRESGNEGGLKGESAVCGNRGSSPVQTAGDRESGHSRSHVAEPRRQGREGKLPRAFLSGSAADVVF